LSNREIRQIALERIAILFQQVDRVVEKNPDLAQSYVDLARKIAMRCRVKIPVAYKRRICKSCYRLLRPGVSSRVRIRQEREPHVAVTCLNCGRVMRYPMRRRR